MFKLSAFLLAFLLTVSAAAASSGRDVKPCVDSRGGFVAGESIDQGAGHCMEVPFLGKVDASKVSLGLFTLFIAGLDGFNPCAFFVLMFLLSLLIHARSRRRILFIGGTFVFFSGLIYFLFMSAWLNVFVLIGRISLITTIAGGWAILFGLINIKDYFYFKEGPSLSISEHNKPKLFQRMRDLSKSSSIYAVAAGTVVLAVAANMYEFLCTAGFPMVYTRVLTLRGLSAYQNYLYLALYNFVYVIPLLAIVVFFAVTLGTRKLTEREGRRLKLVSGIMMLGMGGVLMIEPSVLNNALTAAALLASAVGLTLLISHFTPKRIPGHIEGMHHHPPEGMHHHPPKA